MGNYDPILMKFDTQTMKNMLGSKFRKAGMIDRFQDGRRRHVGTSIRRQKLPYSYNMWLGNRSLNFLINLMLWCMRVFQASI
jgi:hypothetical protein